MKRRFFAVIRKLLSTKIFRFFPILSPGKKFSGSFQRFPVLSFPVLSNPPVHLKSAFGKHKHKCTVHIWYKNWSLPVLFVDVPWGNVRFWWKIWVNTGEQSWCEYKSLVHVQSVFIFERVVGWLPNAEVYHFQWTMAAGRAQEHFLFYTDLNRLLTTQLIPKLLFVCLWISQL